MVFKAPFAASRTPQPQSKIDLNRSAWAPFQHATGNIEQMTFAQYLGIDQMVTPEVVRAQSQHIDQLMQYRQTIQQLEHELASQRFINQQVVQYARTMAQLASQRLEHSTHSSNLAKFTDSGAIPSHTSVDATPTSAAPKSA